jgi:hypothetical protein
MKFLIFFLTFCSCFSQEIPKLNNLKINKSYFFTEQSKEKQNNILVFLDDLFGLDVDDLNKRNYWVKKNDMVLKLPFSDFNYIELRRKGFSNYIPLILSIDEVINQNYKIKIAWINYSIEKPELLAIYNFIYNRDGKLENFLNFDLENYRKYEVGKINFHCKDCNLFNHEDANKLNVFNRFIADFFEIEPLEFDYFIFQDYTELMKAKGFDFETDMYLNNDYGAESYPWDKLILSGNASAYYPHEVVHLYTYEKFHRIHTLVDEGIATYFGGSMGLSFEEHIKLLKKYLIGNEVDFYDRIFESKVALNINNTTSLKYLIGAILCNYAIKSQNKTKLFTLLNSGRSDFELLNVLEKLYNIRKENFNEFIVNE